MILPALIIFLRALPGCGAFCGAGKSLREYANVKLQYHCKIQYMKEGKTPRRTARW